MSQKLVPRKPIVYHIYIYMCFPIEMTFFFCTSILRQALQVTVIDDHIPLQVEQA